MGMPLQHTNNVKPPLHPQQMIIMSTAPQIGVPQTGALTHLHVDQPRGHLQFAADD